MTVAHDLGVGYEADQRARLVHAVERHGFAIIDCPMCDGRDGGCKICEDPDGIVFVFGDMNPCGPACPLKQTRPA